MSDSVKVYTDGACSGNPGPGGWAWVTTSGQFSNGGERETTNQRMELKAVLEAVSNLSGQLDIYSDSTYVVNCFVDKWYEGWIKRGWKNSQKKPVANRDLWEPLVAAFLDRQDEISFSWVQGHSGDTMNDEADRLAVEARDQFVSERDAEAAEVASTETARALAVDVPWPHERAVAVTGVAELTADQREGLVGAIESLDPNHDILVSGLRRGTELEAAELAVNQKIPIAVVLPFDDPAAAWPNGDRERFDSMMSAAQWSVVLKADRTKPGAAIELRNQWLWSAVVGCVVVGEPKRVEELDTNGLGVIEID